MEPNPVRRRPDRRRAFVLAPGDEGSGTLAVTGGDVPTVFVVMTALGALLLLGVLRGARPRPDTEG